VRSLLLLVGVAACWSAPRPTGPAALLRRHHVPGDVLRTCKHGELRMSTKQGQLYVWTMHLVDDERTLAAMPGQFELRSDAVTGSVRFGGKVLPISSTDANESYFVDVRNRRVGLRFDAPAAPAEPPTKFELQSSPALELLVDFPYPERPLRKNETFTNRVTKTVPHGPNAVTSTLTLDVTYRVVNVTPDAIELTCEARQREVVHANGHTLEAAITVACRGQISRRDGQSGRWTITSRGASKLEDETIHTTTRFDVTTGPLSVYQ
jgi:hypothetical protein